MTEQIQQPTESSELETLKQRADMMGIKYHPNTGLDKLKAKINNALDGGEENKAIKELSTGDKEYLTGEEFKRIQESNKKRDINKLVRVRVTCMNPMKKEWEGELISVGSSKLGTFKKYIPYNVEWHIPKIIYDHLKERKCSVFHTVKDARGQKVRKSKLVPEFSIETLPPLTTEELKDLAQRQAMTKGSSEE